jgi:hypothetical protein
MRITAAPSIVQTSIVWEMSLRIKVRNLTPLSISSTAPAVNDRLLHVLQCASPAISIHTKVPSIRHGAAHAAANKKTTRNPYTATASTVDK